MLRKYVRKVLSHRPSQHYQTLNEITLSQSSVLHNVAMFEKQHPDFAIMPVLKANAYGHGLEEIATILNEATCAFVVVDGYFEAAKIRDITKHPILVLGYINPNNAPLLNTKRCSFVVQDIASLEALANLNKPVRIHIELDTGMRRMGLQPHELESYLVVLKQHPQLQVEGVMSHLADADNATSDDFTIDQTKLFDSLVASIRAAGFKPKYIHLTQTAGSLKAKSKYANGIRLGIGLYGLSPLSDKDPATSELQALQPVLELTSTIVKVQALKKGDKVSYSGTFTAPKAMRIGVLPLGYYEGIPRDLSNIGCATRDRQKLPIVGRVCMNHTMIDISQHENMQVGDTVVIYNRDPSAPNSVQNICRDHGLFNYSLVTGISSSIRRRIIT